MTLPAIFPRRADVDYADSVRVREHADALLRAQHKGTLLSNR